MALRRTRGDSAVRPPNVQSVLDVALTRRLVLSARSPVDLPDSPRGESDPCVPMPQPPLSEAVVRGLGWPGTPGFFQELMLSNLLNEAAILTARRHEPASMISPQMNPGAHSRWGLTVAPLQDSAKKALIAYHESGHALNHHLLAQRRRSGTSVTLAALRFPGGVGGFARPLPRGHLDSACDQSALYCADRRGGGDGGTGRRNWWCSAPADHPGGFRRISRWLTPELQGAGHR